MNKTAKTKDIPAESKYKIINNFKNNDLFIIEFLINKKLAKIILYKEKST